MSTSEAPQALRGDNSQHSELDSGVHRVAPVRIATVHNMFPPVKGDAQSREFDKCAIALKVAHAYIEKIADDTEDADLWCAADAIRDMVKALERRAASSRAAGQ